MHQRYFWSEESFVAHGELSLYLRTFLFDALLIFNVTYLVQREMRFTFKKFYFQVKLIMLFALHFYCDMELEAFLSDWSSGSC